MRYLLLILISILLILSTKDNKNKNKYILLSAVILIVYTTFRANIPGAIIGNDYNSYFDWFNRIGNINIFNLNNFLFNLLLLIVKVTTNNYHVLLLIISSLLVFSIYRFSFDNTKANNYVWSIFIFIAFGMYDLSVSAMRQWIACSIFLLSFKFISNKDLKRYIILILIASLFHNSAIILLPTYFIININLSKKKKLLFAFILTFVLTIMLQFDLDLLFISIIDKTYLIKYTSAIKNGLVSNYTVFIISFSCFFTMILFWNKYIRNSKNPDVDFNYLLLLVSISFLATKSALCCRFLQYFMPALMLAIPGIIQIFNGKMRKFLTFLAILLLSLIYIL